MTGCTPPKQTPALLLTDTPSADIATGKITATQTSAAAEPTQYPTAVITPTVVKRCFSIQPKLPEEYEYKGRIVFETHRSKEENSISFFDFKTAQITEMKSVENRNLSVSADRTMFALEDDKSSQLSIFSASGKRLKSLAWGKNWGSITSWLGNTQIAIGMAEPDSINPRLDKYPRDVLVINPFSNQMQIFTADYPNIDRGSENASWEYSLSTMVFDPTLTRVVYPGGGIKFENNVMGGYYLYGIPEKKVLAQLPCYRWNQPPIWSPDGSQFIVDRDNEFYLVSVNGNITKLTRLNQKFETLEKTDLRYYIEYYSWSPDGRYVAFWLAEYSGNVDQNQSQLIRTLAIVDVQTGKIIDTCIPAGYTDSNFQNFPYPVWAPDGKNLIVIANYQKEDGGYDTVLVDLQKQTAYKFAKKLSPVGWLITP